MCVCVCVYICMCIYIHVYIHTHTCINVYIHTHTCICIYMHIVIVVELSSYFWLFVTPWTAAHQSSMYLTISQSSPKLSQVHWWCHPAILSSDALFSFCPQSSQYKGLFQWVICSNQMTKILELQHQSFQWVFRADLPKDWLISPPCCPRDFQESSP